MAGNFLAGDFLGGYPYLHITLTVDETRDVFGGNLNARGM